MAAAKVGLLAPTSKVAAGGVGGAAAVIVLWVLSAFHVDLPSTVSTAVTLVVTVASAYLVRETNPVEEPAAILPPPAFPAPPIPAPPGPADALNEQLRAANHPAEPGS